MQKRRFDCPDCIFSSTRKIKHNIYYCELCYNYFISEKGLFEKYDIKRIDIVLKTFSSNIILRLYVFDILKIMSLLKRDNSTNYYYQILKEYLMTVEKELNMKINFERKLPKYKMKELLK